MTKNLSPTHPLGYLLLMLGVRADGEHRNERGASAVEWIIISAIVVGVCGLIAAILVPALQGEANEISDEIRRQ